MLISTHQYICALLVINFRRVRHNLAKVFSTVTGSLGFVGSKHAARQTEVFQFFANLLQDNEAEVRAAAVENIARMAQLGGAELFQKHIAPLLPVRTACLFLDVVIIYCQNI